MPGRATSIPELSQTYRKPGKFQKFFNFLSKIHQFLTKKDYFQPKQGLRGRKLGVIFSKFKFLVFLGINFETNQFSGTIFEIDKANAFTFLSRKSFARVDKLWPNNAPALWKTGELVIDLELRYFG